jgi:hypothetical protein
LRDTECSAGAGFEMGVYDDVGDDDWDEESEHPADEEWPR